MTDPIIQAAETAVAVANPFGAIEAWFIRAATWLVVVLVAVVAVGGGAILAWEHFEHPAVPKTEAAAPAVVQADGSLALQRDATAPTTQPFNDLPKGAKLIRRDSVTVQPKALPVAPGQIAGPLPKSITTNLDLDRMPDGSERVVASSPDGTVTGGIDIPVAPLPPDPPKNAAGISYSLPIGGVHQEGIWIERDIWRVRLGLEIDHTASPRASINSAVIRAGITF